MSSIMSNIKYSEDYDWGTPQKLFDAISSKWGPFTLDVCGSSWNHRYFTLNDNALVQSWRCDNSRAYMNPPYGKVLGRWVHKAYLESRKGITVVCLIPACTDSVLWHSYVMRAYEISFVKGRVIFQYNSDLGEGKPAPFPSVVVVFTRHARNYPKTTTLKYK